MAAIDIKGAYLNAEMDKEEVLMELDPTLTRMVQRIDPKMKTYVGENGKLVVQLKKALYGCIQSAKLWYERLTQYLESIGFIKNKVDQCVMNKIVNGKQLTVMIFVDDILATCENLESVDELARDLEKEFGEITIQYDSEGISYLGMHLSRDGDKVNLSMKAYLETILDDSNVTKSVTTPANGNLFNVNEKDKNLVDKEKQEFHTVVAKLLYLAKRTRPDVLLPVSYLCTRVREPTENDRLKLERVLKYLNGTRDMKLVLDGVGELVVDGFIDAGFGSHADAKSHTGLVVKLAGSTVLCKSSKQKIVTKDSTEAELVALSDMKNEVIKCWEFVVEQGYDLPPPKLLQDNMSTIEIVKHGGGKYRNKYMRVRQALVKESIDNGEAEVRFVRTQDMAADIFTKALQGKLFFDMASGLLGSAKQPDATGVR